MNNPAKIDGRVYLDFEITAETASKFLMLECKRRGSFGIADDFSREMLKNLETIGRKYGKGFGKDGKEAKVPVNGYYDPVKKDYFVTSDEIIKGLFHVFTSYTKMEHIFSNEKYGVFEDMSRHNLDATVLYPGKAAHEAFEAIKYIRDNYNEFIKRGKVKNSADPNELVQTVLLAVNCDLNPPGWGGSHYLGYDIRARVDEVDEMKDFIKQMLNKYGIPLHFGIQEGEHKEIPAGKLLSREELEKKIADGADDIRRYGELSREEARKERQ